MHKLYPLLKPTSQIQLDANMVNKYFADICTRDLILSQPRLPCRPSFSWPDTVDFKFSSITALEVRKSWKLTKNKNSTSTDNLDMCNIMLNHCMKSDHFIGQLSTLFNIYINSGTLPSLLKLSKVIPIPKKPNPTSGNDLRPISLQPTIAKLFAKCIFEQLFSYLEYNKMFSNFQFGGRKHHSTAHALIAITDYVYKALDNNNFVIFIALDIRKAYDRCDPEVLLHKLRYGINEQIIESFLTDRKQFVYMKCNNRCCSSDTLPTNMGVAQGLCLSCLLFLIMMNDLPLCICNSLCIKFVDDTGILISGEIGNISETVSKLESDLLNICNWMKSSRLELNNDKCEMMVIAAKKHIQYVQDISVKLDGVPMKRVNFIKILGIIIDNDLKFNLQCDKVAEKCNFALWSLYSLKGVLDVRHKIMVVQALILPIIMYCCPIWLVGSSNLKCINNILRRCARFVYGKSKFDSISDEIIVDLEWLNANLTNCCKFEMSKIAFNMYNNIGPGIFRDYICQEKRIVRATRTVTYSEPNIICNGLMRKSFQYRASKTVLNLPVRITEKLRNLSIIEFKRLVKCELVHEQCTERMVELFDILDDHDAL